MPEITSAFEEANSILNWWERARASLAEHLPEAVPQIDDDAKRLQRLLQADQDVVICFLGQSNVGKSTLINALVAGSESVLPTVGIGPLTALATQVRFSEEPYFRVRYIDAQRLGGIRLALESELRKQAKPVGPPDQAQADDQLPPSESTASAATAGQEAAVAEEPEWDEPVDETATPGDHSSRFAELRRQIGQVVKGNQYKGESASLEELVVGFRAVLGLETQDLPRLSEEDATRVRRAAAALASSRDGTVEIRSAASTMGDFRAALREHVSGSLAPLVAEIEVGWPSDLLRGGLVLVDLPGVGVASDQYRAVTSKFIGERARAVVLVTDRSGPTAASVEMIKDTGYWVRLLVSSDNPESDPCALLIAVARVDQLADEEWLVTHDLPDGEKKTKAELLAAFRLKAEKEIAHQAKDVFGKLVLPGDGDNRELNDGQVLPMQRFSIRCGCSPFLPLSIGRSYANRPTWTIGHSSRSLKRLAFPS